MIVKLLTEHHMEFLTLKEGLPEASSSLHLSKCQIVGNLIPWLSYYSCISQYQYYAV